MLPDDLIDEVQPHPGACDGADIARAVIALADVTDLVARDAHAAILYHDLDEAAVRARLERHGTLFGRVFEGVETRLLNAW